MTARTQSREAEKRMEQYTPPSELDIPRGLQKFYNDQGFKLRWIRYSVDNQLDERNITRAKREGFIFVGKGEIPEDYKDYFSTTRIGQNNSVICQGDLILGKIETVQSDLRQRHYEQQSTEAVESTRQEARSTGGNRNMDKYVPIVDETEDPEVYVGRVKKT